MEWQSLIVGIILGIVLRQIGIWIEIWYWKRKIAVLHHQMLYHPEEVQVTVHESTPDGPLTSTTNLRSLLYGDHDEDD